MSSMIHIIPEIVSVVDKDFLTGAYLTRSVYSHPDEACFGAFVRGIVGGKSGVGLAF